MSCVASALTAAGFSLPGSSGEPVTPQTLNKYLVDNEGCVHARTHKMFFFSLPFLTHLICTEPQRFDTARLQLAVLHLHFSFGQCTPLPLTSLHQSRSHLTIISLDLLDLTHSHFTRLTHSDTSVLDSLTEMPLC
jgi:hypothetical protein